MTFRAQRFAGDLTNIAGIDYGQRDGHIFGYHLVVGVASAMTPAFPHDCARSSYRLFIGTICGKVWMLS